MTTKHFRSDWWFAESGSQVIWWENGDIALEPTESSQCSFVTRVVWLALIGLSLNISLCLSMVRSTRREWSWVRPHPSCDSTSLLIKFSFSTSLSLHIYYSHSKTVLQTLQVKNQRPMLSLGVIISSSTIYEEAEIQSSCQPTDAWCWSGGLGAFSF